MAINLHTKYSSKIATVFKSESLIDGKLNDEYSFSGVRTVKISTLQTVPLVDYVRNGSIITFHDSIKAEKNMKYALPRAIEWLLEQGYEFKVFD